MPSTSCHWFLCFGTPLRHQTRAPCLGPPRLKKAKSNFFTNCNILHTLKNEPLNIMLLHTSRRIDGSRGLVIQPPKLSVGAYFELSFLGCGFLIHLFQQVRQPSIPSPVEEDTPKIRDTTGTVFIQGSSIVLPVWRCMMFNDSYLSACMKLRIVQKNQIFPS